jgi:hypothetical protein
VAESDIQRAILDAFQAMGVLAFRINSGKVRARGGWYQGAPAGFPDVLVVVPPHGRLLGLEVKTATGKERAKQVEMAEHLCGAGAAVRTVRTTEEAIRAYLESKDAPRVT